MKIVSAKRKVSPQQIIGIVTYAIVTAVAFAIVVSIALTMPAKYNAAVELYNAGEYDAAIIAFTELRGYRDSKSRIEKCYIEGLGEDRYNLLKSIKIGDTYIFGAYEQDNMTSNGKEEIEWIVLDKAGTSLLLISKYALDCQPYNTWENDVTWETSSIRKWLNGVFLNIAFRPEEQKLIKSTTVRADMNRSYRSVNSGEDTTDKVFLLSVTEAKKYYKSDDARKCAPTTYARVLGAWTSSTYYTEGKPTCLWWTRTPGSDSQRAVYINADGSLDFLEGDTVNSNLGTVRPALWINIGL